MKQEKYSPEGEKKSDDKSQHIFLIHPHRLPILVCAPDSMFSFYIFRFLLTLANRTKLFLVCKSVYPKRLFRVIVSERKKSRREEEEVGRGKSNTASAL